MQFLLLFVLIIAINLVQIGDARLVGGGPTGKQQGSNKAQLDFLYPVLITDDDNDKNPARPLPQRTAPQQQTSGRTKKATFFTPSPSSRKLLSSLRQKNQTKPPVSGNSIARTTSTINVTRSNNNEEQLAPPTPAFNISDTADYRLYQKLIGTESHYLKHMRPLPNSSHPIVVDVGISVNMVEELIERDQTMVMVATVKMKWIDSFLTWDPKEYNNIRVIAVPTDLVWLPDITVVNSPETIRLTHKTTHVQVDHRGEIGYYPSGRLMTRCNLHIKYFPFDRQHCEVLLESWIYPIDQLQIMGYTANGGATVDVRETYTNHQWALTGHKIQLGITLYDGYNFSSIAFVFLLERKSEYYFMYYVFPQLLLACLQTLSHTIPVEHPGRMTLLTSLFIGTSVTQASVADHIPKSSDSTSLLQIYMTINSINLVLSLLVTFFMMYAVLRIPSMHPEMQPSLVAMIAGFFKVTWPPSPFETAKKALITGIGQSLNNNKAIKEEEEEESNNNDSEENGDVNRSSISSDQTRQKKCHFSPHVRWSTNSGELVVPDNQGLFLRQQKCDGDKTEGDKQDRFVNAFVETELSQIVKQRRYNILVNSRSESLSVKDGEQVLVKSTLSPQPAVSEADSRLRRSSLRKQQSEESEQIVRSRKISNGSGWGYESIISGPTSPEPVIVNSKNKKPIGAKQRQPTKEQSNDEARDIKRYWLLYSVAVDKTLMYAQAVWHTFIPIYLFVVVPYFAPGPEPHIHIGDTVED